MRTVLLSILILAVAAPLAGAQSTAFTYQGRLDNGAQAASGVHDFRFTLFDVVSGGVQLVPPQCVDNVAVTSGLFTTTLDFGQQFATTSPRYLQIEVRADTGLSCANPAGLVLLGPRQLLTAAPMASTAKTALTLSAPDGSPAQAVFVDNAGNVGVGTTAPIGRLHVNGVLAWGGIESTMAFSGQDTLGLYLEQNGNSVVNSRIRVQSSRAGDLVNYTQLIIDPNVGFMFTGIGTAATNVGIGTTSPLSKLDVRGDIRLGPTGQYRAVAGDENLRMVRGNISGSGTILQGSGFTVSRRSEGIYDITFSPAFAGTPSVTAMAHWPTADGHRTCVIQNSFLLPGSVPIIVNSGGGTGHVDSNFSFIAVGPR